MLRACLPENGSDLHITSVRRYDTIALGLLKNRKKNAKLRFFTSRGTYVNCAIIAMFTLINFDCYNKINNYNNRPPACTSTSLRDRKQGIKE